MGYFERIRLEKSLKKEWNVFNVVVYCPKIYVYIYYCETQYVPFIYNEYTVVIIRG